MKIKFTRSIIFLSVLTLIAGGLPLLIYFSERVSGILLSENIWYESGVNHGPWRSGIESMLVYYPLILLLSFTIIFSIIQAIKKNWTIFRNSMLICIIQVILIFLQMYYLTWTID
jgi:hypothetical protein